MGRLLRWSGVVERCVGYVNNLQVIWGSFADIIYVIFLLSRFEPLSGAIMNHSSESKLIDLGEWWDGLNGLSLGSSLLRLLGSLASS